MFDTKNALIEKLKTNQEKLNDDEYIGEDGLPYCKTCGGARYFCVNDEKGIYMRTIWCKHRKEEQQRAEEEEARRKRIEEFNARQESSLIGKRYKNIRFNDARITEHNREAYEKCKRYLEQSEAMLKENIGLYIHGENSTGKTYLTACLCNELVWQRWRCVYTNLATILSQIRGTYGSRGGSENSILQRLQNYDFVFIDDLGKEFIGRDYNPASSKWAEEKFFEIINARYNANAPIIFSSNYTIAELESVLGFDKAIVERINEMATRVIKLTGDDFRQTARASKSTLSKKYGI